MNTFAVSNSYFQALALSQLRFDDEPKPRTERE
jgi:hypothetical protein